VAAVDVYVCSLCVSVLIAYIYVGDRLYLCPLVCACVYELSSMSPLDTLIACIALSGGACVTRP